MVFCAGKLKRKCYAPAVIHQYGGYWIAGQRADRNNCSTPFVWKQYRGDDIPMQFTKGWKDGQPNCWTVAAGLTGSGPTHNLRETCMHYWMTNSVWNDLTCAWPSCVLCELDGQ